MPKLTLVEPETQIDTQNTPADPEQALGLLYDFIQIKDPALQQAVLDLLHALARATGG